MIAIVHSIYSQSVHAPARDAGLMDNDAERYCICYHISIICVIVNMVQFTLVNYIIIYCHLASFMPSSIDIIYYPATSHISTSI